MKKTLIESLRSIPTRKRLLEEYYFWLSNGPLSTSEASAFTVAFAERGINLTAQGV